MNWGFRIILLYASFVALILTLVFKANGEKIELVTQDYYAQELIHTQKMNAVERGLTVKDQVKIQVEKDVISISFPESFKEKNGAIDFYRPSDSSLDKHFDLTIDSNNLQQISTSAWKMGYYAIKIQWESDGQAHLIEDTIFIP